MEYAHKIYRIIILLACLSAETEARILFVSNEDGNDEVYSMLDSGANPINLTRHPAWDTSPTWSPDGKTILFSSSRKGNGERDIYLMDAAGNNVRQLFRRFDFGFSFMPIWSPDGTKIAFLHFQRQGPLWDIYLTNPNGRPPIPMTRTAAVPKSSPNWSPDGKEIAFISHLADSKTIDIVNVDTKRVRRLVAFGFNGSPAWSPDGTKIAFVKQDGIGNIYWIHSNGGDSIKVTPGDGAKDSPIWSPDGREIAFMWWQKNGPILDADIFVINVDGTNRRRLTDRIGRDRPTDWLGPAVLSVEPEKRHYSTWGNLKALQRIKHVR